MKYSTAIQFALLAFWFVGSIAVARFIHRRLCAYFGSVGLFVPAVAYSLYEYGALEMGGILHALVAGLYVLPFHFYFHRSEWREVTRNR